MRQFLAVVVLSVMGCSAGGGKAEQVLQAGRDCDAAAQLCEAKGATGTLSFSMAKARTMQPTTVHAKWRGARAESVLVSFEMVGMEMGENRYRLVPDGQGGWVGNAVLPVCVKGRSDWVADLKVKTEGGLLYTARFPFTVLP